MEAKIITQITECLTHNEPLLLIGASGWGKSQIIAATSKELGFELVDLRLAQIPPEDIGGIPVNDQGTSFKYLLPNWAKVMLDNPYTTYVLFLDEINQASASVLNAIYSIVLDRKVAGTYIPNMRIAAAGNYDYESDYLTELPQPLVNRFIRLTMPENWKLAKKYLSNKYKGIDLIDLIPFIFASENTTGLTNPRAVDRALRLIFNGCRDINILNNSFSKELTHKIIDYINQQKIAAKFSQADKNTLNFISSKIKGNNIILDNGNILPLNIMNLQKVFGDQISKEIYQIIINHHQKTPDDAN